MRLNTTRRSVVMTVFKIDVKDATIAYQEEGKGEPIVFIHGMPTSSYLWRNIIPELSSMGRCLAIDLIGMGASSKPDITYSIEDHIDYFEAWVAKMNLTSMVLVLHGWGSVVGFEYAKRHPEKIKGLAFYEGHLKSLHDWDELSLPIQEWASRLGNKDMDQVIYDEHFLVESFLPEGVYGGIAEEVLRCYRQPFLKKEHRKVLRQYMDEVPVGRPSSSSMSVIDGYTSIIASLDVPKLLLYATPGFVVCMRTILWCKKNCINLSLYDLGHAYHFAQESCPERFSAGIKQWLADQVLSVSG